MREDCSATVRNCGSVTQLLNGTLIEIDLVSGDLYPEGGDLCLNVR